VAHLGLPDVLGLSLRSGYPEAEIRKKRGGLRRPADFDELR